HSRAGRDDHSTDREEAGRMTEPGREQFPSVARVYDYYLGGTANTPADRRFGDKVLGRFPLVRHIAVANRTFLRRAVHYLTRLGVRQFVDLGSGLPTMGSTHSIASGSASVVYVDHD